MIITSFLSNSCSELIETSNVVVVSDIEVIFVQSNNPIIINVKVRENIFEVGKIIYPSIMNGKEQM